MPWHSAQQWSHAPWFSGPPAPWGIAPAPWGVAPASTMWIMPPMPAPQPPPSSIPKPESSVFSSKTNPGREKVWRKQWSEELRCVEIVKKRIRQREEDLLRAFEGNVNFNWPVPLPCNARGKPYTYLKYFWSTAVCESAWKLTPRFQKVSTQPAPVIESMQKFMDEMFNYLGHPLSPDALKQDLTKAVKEKMAELQLMILAGKPCPGGISDAMWEHVNQCVAEENEECKEDFKEIELLADSYFSGSKPPKITTISCSCGGNPFGPQLSSWVLLLEKYVKKLTPNIINLPDAQGQGIQIQVPRVAVLKLCEKL